MTEQNEEPISDYKEASIADFSPGDKAQKNSGKDVVRIALDAMGGDNAPEAIIDGAIDAVEAIKDLHVTLVGDEEMIKKVLADRSCTSPDISIRKASEAIGMEEAPSVALRKKKDSSIHVGVKMVKENEVDAFISAGHTGAVMTVAAVILRTLEGIDRAAIAVTLPNPKGHTVLLDIGANVVCKSTNLYQFGVMGSNYARYVLDDQTPRVGLLSIGEEDIKGNAVTRGAFELLTGAPSINFVGNIEAKLLFNGVAEVVICDGFTGNIALKSVESIVGMINGLLKEMLTSNLRGKIAGLLLKPALLKMKKRIDHTEVGGAPLLGVDGAIFICHGSSNAKSVTSALRSAIRFVKQDVNGHIKESLKETPHDPMEDSGFWERVKTKIGLSPSDERENK